MGKINVWLPSSATLTMGIALALFAISSCKKEKKFPERIVGVWEYSDCGDCFPPCCNGYHEVYDENNWFVVLNSSSCLNVQGEDCTPVIDTVCRNNSIANGFDPVSESLPYMIVNDLLIRSRHLSLFDQSTPIIIDTLRISRIKNCVTNEGGIMKLHFLNRTSAQSYGIPEGEDYTLKRRAYSKSGNACGTPCG